MFWLKCWIGRYQHINKECDVTLEKHKKMKKEKQLGKNPQQLYRVNALLFAHHNFSKQEGWEIPEFTPPELLPPCPTGLLLSSIIIRHCDDSLTKCVIW
jgi:hypothetical protein